MVRFDSRILWFRVRLGGRSSLGLALTMSALGPMNSVSAQVEREPPAEYDAEVSAALDDHEAGRFEAAREHFFRAHAVFPNARTLRGLGKVEFELGHYVEAFQYLQGALKSQVRTLPSELRSEVETLLERCRDFVGELALDVKPDSAQIAVDGITLATGPHAELVLAEGDHVLELRATGRLTERRQLAMHARDHLQLAVALSEVPVPAAVVHAPAAPVKHDVPARRKWWVWTVSGVALVGTATAAVLLATREREHGTGAAWTVRQP
jgi:tetratricopeptide (TPR) repeat protein